jgi:hypothetical protein
MTPEVWDEVTVRGQGHPGAYDISQVKWLTIVFGHVLPLLLKTAFIRHELVDAVIKPAGE